MASTILMIQGAFIIRWAAHFAQPGGRAHILLIIGAVISLVGIMIRVVSIVSGSAPEMRYDVSNLRQSISISIGTVTVMMISLGLVLLSKERSEVALRHLALRDALTDIPNRRAILECLENEIERARRTRSVLSLAIIDIDHFKIINDQYGHLVGDVVLRHCVDTMKQRLRRNDNLGRWGGEEFLLLLPDTNAEGAVVSIDGLRTQVVDHPTEVDGERIPHSFSAGIWSGIPGPNDSSTTLIAAADTALYEAKASGRNGLRVAERRVV